MHFRNYFESRTAPLSDGECLDIWSVICDHGGDMTIRQLYMRVRNRTGFERVDTLKAVLDKLEDERYIELVKTKPQSGIGRPGVTIRMVRTNTGQAA